MDKGIQSILNSPSRMLAANWEMQGILQLDARVKHGDFAGTLAENTIFAVNVHLAEKWGATGLARGGLWLANNLCVGGLELARALGTKVSNDDAITCARTCGNSAHKCGSGDDANCAQITNFNGCCFCTNIGQQCDKHTLWPDRLLISNSMPHVPMYRTYL